MRQLLTMICAVSCAWAALGRNAHADGGDARAAWLDVMKREYAFLEAERDALAKRLGEVKAEASRDIGGSEGRIAAMEGELASSRAAADAAEQKLAELERAATVAEDKAELAPETTERARASLEPSGLAPAVKGDLAGTPSDIPALLEAAKALMSRDSTLDVRPGTFFTREGTRVDGQIVRLGGVFAWGVSEGVSGALAPAGGGRGQLWVDAASETARALAGGTAAPTIRGMMFDDPNKRIEPRVERDFVQYTTVGGPLAWVIVVVGGLAMLAMLLRAWFVMRLGTARSRLARRLAPILSLAERDSDAGRAALQERLDHAFLAESPRLERFGTLITVLAAIAPLLGLLGTVTGMIATFDAITAFGNSDPKQLSGGISEALITTEYGLMVAIPTLFLGTLLTGRANAVLSVLERDVLAAVTRTLGPDVAHTLELPSRKSPRKPDGGTATGTGAGAVAGATA